MNAPYVCQYCGLTTRPLNYHEGPEACQEAMRAFTTRLREFLPKAQPFISAWEFDSWDLGVDGETWWKELADKVGVGSEWEGVNIYHVITTRQDRIYMLPSTTSQTNSVESAIT